MEVKMLCPTRAVVDATGNRNDGGLAVEVCSSLRMVSVSYTHLTLPTIYSV